MAKDIRDFPCPECGVLLKNLRLKRVVETPGVPADTHLEVDLDNVPVDKGKGRFKRVGGQVESDNGAEDAPEEE